MIIFVRKRIQCFIDFRFYSMYRMRMRAQDFIPMIIFVRRIQCFIDFRFYSTYRMLMSGRDGPPTLCLRMTCVQRMPSCWRGSTGTPWSLTRQARPLSSSWTSTKKRVSKRPGKRFQGKCFLLSCLIYMSFLKPSIARRSSMYFLLFSFLDDAFRKNLESAIRFGNPLLVQVGVLSTFLFLWLFLVKGRVLKKILNLFFNRMLRAMTQF